jgi:hypothetical protein
MNRPCPQCEVALNVPEVRRPFTWARTGDPRPPESISKSTKPPTAARKPERWRAREWRRMLEEGVYANQSALARAEGVSAAAVSAAVQKLTEA